MVEMSPELVTIIMFGGIFIGILSGYPLALILGGVAMFVGFAVIGPVVFKQFMMRIFALATNYYFLAVPLFVFMGEMVEKSGAAERLYSGLYLLFGRLRGGLAIGTIFMGTILAACVGIVAASVVMIGLIAVPSMLKRGYNKELIAGSVCAGGTLGILIPPSVMLVIYGPMAQISVGKLFMGAFGPGLVLSSLYISYIAIRCLLSPKIAPAISVEEQAVPMLKKLYILLTGVIPPGFLILAVLGSIFFGIAAPTEAAAVGALAASLLVIAYRRFNWQVLRESMLYTLRLTCMIYLIAFGAQMFVGVFLKLGGGEVISNLVLGAPGGRWGVFAIIMFLVFILGFAIDYIGIIFIIVPLVTPIAADMGFDPVWFAIMVCVNLQMSYMTPPMAPSIFFLKGIAQREWGLTIGIIIRGVIPFVGLIIIGLILCVLFPQIITWLPSIMIK